MSQSVHYINKRVLLFVSLTCLLLNNDCCQLGIARVALIRDRGTLDIARVSLIDSTEIVCPPIGRPIACWPLFRLHLACKFILSECIIAIHPRGTSLGRQRAFPLPLPRALPLSINATVKVLAAEGFAIDFDTIPQSSFSLSEN